LRLIVHWLSHHDWLTDLSSEAAWVGQLLPVRRLHHVRHRHLWSCLSRSHLARWPGCHGLGHHTHLVHLRHLVGLELLHLDLVSGQVRPCVLHRHWLLERIWLKRRLLERFWLKRRLLERIWLKRRPVWVLWSRLRSCAFGLELVHCFLLLGDLVVADDSRDDETKQKDAKNDTHDGSRIV